MTSAVKKIEIKYLMKGRKDSRILSPTWIELPENCVIFNPIVMETASKGNKLEA